MMNWGLYWKRKGHKRRKSCTLFDTIDSFQMFKYKEGLEWVRASQDKVCFIVTERNVVARLMDDYSLSVTYDGGAYVIPIEKKTCNYGGFYHFFHCPQCDKKMRKLYLVEGKYTCRKCANLAYYKQRLSSSERNLHMYLKVEEFLKNRAGALDRKPPWMKKHTFHKLRKKYLDYSEKRFYATVKEIRGMYGARAQLFDDHYSMFVPSGFYDVYDYKD